MPFCRSNSCIFLKCSLALRYSADLTDLPILPSLLKGLRLGDSAHLKWTSNLVLSLFGRVLLISIF